MFAMFKAEKSGSREEKAAATYLRSQGLKLLQKNYGTKAGEIDLIMQESNTLVFVEVRYRRQSAFGSPLETVNLKKQQRIIKAASQYLVENYKDSPPSCRFDVIGVEGQPYSFNWIPNAFGV